MTETPAVQDEDPLLGQVLDRRFRIVRLIDRGGMGRVYEAIQEPLGRRVAVKTMDLADPGGELKSRFFNEARLCSKLSHPNTVRIHDYGATSSGVYYIAMELLDGRNLRRVLKADGPFSPKRALTVMIQLAGAIGEAHANGIVHRDLKPSNIILCQHGQEQDFAKVLDFGLVKELSVEAGLSRRDHVLGSPMYMAPEQVEGKATDQRADVYALGLLLWTLLTGKSPFKADTSAALMMQQLWKEPPPLRSVLPEGSVPPPASLEALLRLCIAKDPAARPSDAREVERALRAIQRELGGELPPLTLALDSGRLILPAGAEERTEERRPITQGLETKPESSGTLRPLATGPVAAVGMGVVFLAAAGTALLAAVLTAGLVFWALREPPPPPAAELRSVQLNSEPNGAEVWRGQALIGTTPLRLELAVGEVLDLELRREGHRTRPIQVDGRVDPVQVPLELAPAPPAAAPAPPAPSEPAPAPRPAPARAAPPPPPESPAPAPVAAPAAAPRSRLDAEIKDPWEEP